MNGLVKPFIVITNPPHTLFVFILFFCNFFTLPIFDIHAQVVLDEEAMEMMPVDSDLDIRANVVIGLDPNEPFRRSRAWVPIRIELNNQDDDFQGVLIVQIKDGEIVYQTPVDLPSRAKNLYTMYVFLPETLDELEFYLQTGRKKIDFEVVTVATPSVESTRFIAVLSSERGSHEILAHRDEDEKAEIFRDVVYTSSLYLPKAWVGMENIDVLVWDGDEQFTMTPEQEEALDQWIQMGGTLVLACGDRWQMVNDTGLRLYSPVTMSGSTVLQGNLPLTISEEVSFPVLQPSVVAATGELIDDEKVKVRLEAGDIPFLVERQWGAGKIVWIASSIRQPLFEPLYQELFLQYLAESNLSFIPVTVDNIDEPTTSFLKWLTQEELPSTAFVAMYLGLYIIILVPVNYLVFRSIKRLEWAWFTIPIWAVVFAYGAYYIGSLSQLGEVVANQISVIRSKPNASYAESTTYCSVYSPIRKWYTLYFENPKAFPMLVAESMFRQRSSLASTQNMTVSFEPGVNRIDDFLIYHWSSRAFKTQHTMPIGEGVDLNVRFRDNQLEGRITNNTPFTLTEPRLVLKDRVIRLSGLQPGDSVDVSGRWQRAEPLEKQNTFQRNPRVDYGRRNNDPEAFIKDVLAEDYAKYYFQDPETQSNMLFAAHTDVSTLEFQLERNFVSPKGQSLFCVISKVKQVMEGARQINPNEWQYEEDALYQQFSGMGGYGFAHRPYTEIQPQQEYNGIVKTDFPLEQAEIIWLRIEFDQNRVEDIGNARFLSRQAQLNNVVEDQPGLYIRNRVSSRYELVDDITGANGFIKNPQNYIDPANGIITYKYANPTSNRVRLHKNNLIFSMEIDYGSPSDDSFLGFSLDLAKKEFFDI